jgi:tellurite resistance protein
MTPRNAAAAEMQTLLEQLQGLCARAERLAQASGIVDPKWFRGAHTAVTMAAGEMDAKGLISRELPQARMPAEPGVEAP